jgi:hypothetical protein
VPVRNAASLRRHPRAGLAYHVFTSDRRARVSRRGERTAPEVPPHRRRLVLLGARRGERGHLHRAPGRSAGNVPAANLAFSAYGTVQSLQMLQRSLDLGRGSSSTVHRRPHEAQRSRPARPRTGRCACLSPTWHRRAGDSPSCGRRTAPLRRQPPVLGRVLLREASRAAAALGGGDRGVDAPGTRTPRPEAPDDPATRERILERLSGTWPARPGRWARGCRLEHPVLRARRHHARCRRP